MKKNYLVVLVILLITILMLSFTTCFAKSFTDLDNTHWAFNYVDKLSNNGVINGYEDGTFNPSGTVTRAEFIKLIVCTNESLKNAIEKRSSNKVWYKKYTDYANAMGLIPYEYTDEEYTGPISRKEMTRIIEEFSRVDGLYKEKDTLDNDEVKTSLLKLAQKKGYIKGSASLDKFEELWSKISQSRQQELLQEIGKNYQEESLNKYNTDFSDVNDINILDKKSIYIAKELKIINGYEDNTFRPDAFMTRAEVSVVIYNYLSLLEKR